MFTVEEIRDVVKEMKPKFLIADELRVQKVLDATKDLDVEVITIGRSQFSEISFNELLLEQNELGIRFFCINYFKHFKLCILQSPSLILIPIWRQQLG